MPRPRASEPPPPRPGHHHGRRCYLTRWRTISGKQPTMRWYVESPAKALREYRAWLKQWHADPRIRDPFQPQELTVEQLGEVYKTWAERNFVVRGRRSTHVIKISTAVALLAEQFGATLADDLTAPDLAAFRELIITGDNGTRSASTVNAYLSAVKRCYRWAAERGLISPATSAAMREVAWVTTRSGATAGNPVESVSESIVRKTVGHLPAHVAAMVWLQWHTGMRPDEVCSMEGRLIERPKEAKIWIYRPSHHKLAHHGSKREIAIGPQAQAVLQPWLNRMTILFRPRDSECATGDAGKRYTSASYRRAITRACDAANVPRWSPNQLRHAFATRVKQRLGIDASRAALGHTTADTTQVYLDRDRELAARAALEVG